MMAHPFGLHLEAVSDWNEGCDLALIGFEIVRVHGFVLLLVLGKAGADFIETFLDGVKLPLEVLDFFGVVLVAFVEGAEKTIDEAPQIFRGHFKDGQHCGSGPWGEGERKRGGVLLSFIDRWWYG